MIRAILCFAIVFLPIVVFAQGSSEFTIQVFGNTDTEAPTTPVIDEATPVATSQIDLTWSTSTDNFMVVGYVVFRDSVAIATTTAVNYSDTGLNASTTYTYTVRAFDARPNYSSSSAPVATTTLPAVVQPEEAPTGGSEGTQVRLVLESFDISTGVATASMDIVTRDVSRIEVRIGATPSYELAYVVGNSFKTTHDILINDLQPATKYYYEVIGYTPSGAQTLLRQGTFVTNSDQPPLPPANVSGLVAVQQGDSVVLTYELPADFPTDGRVRVVRNHLGFPLFLSDGIVVYEGAAERVVDDAVFQFYDRAYYTVFVVDPNGLVSSGAVVVVNDARQRAPGTPTPLPNPSTPPDTPDLPDSGSTSSDPATDPTALQIIDPPIIATGFPELADFIVEQNERIFPFSSTTISLTSEQSFVVSVPVSEVSGDFKTMVATLSDPRDSGKSFSFLLRLSGDRTEYSAVIAPLKVGGVSILTVEVFDYDTKVISRYETRITFSAPTMASTTLETWYWRVQSWLWGLLLLVPLIVLAFVWFILWKRDGQDEDNNVI